MRWFKNLSIKRKLIVVVMLATGNALLLACVVFIIYDRMTFKESMVLDLNVIAQIIGDNSMAALIFNDVDNANEILSALRAEKCIVTAHIYTGEGKRFASYVRGGVDGDAAPIPLTREGHYFSDDHLSVLQRIKFDGKEIGAVYLKADLRDLGLRLKRYAGIGILVMFISSLGALIVSAKLLGIISRPASHLANVARTVSISKDYSLRAQKQSNDELGFLTERFNEMLAQIQDRDVALQNAHDQIEKRAQQLQRELLERRRANARIKTSLKEKEVLLKEIHHRVKNNLQIVSSLLELQSDFITDSKALEIFRECRNRVKSMAMIHEKLYRSKDLASINSSEYVDNLLASLHASYMANSDHVALKANVKNVFLDIDVAIPCGLIINELVSNALKYAFPNGTGGCIEVELKSERDFLILSVRDNGVGLPLSVDVRNTETLGLQLVTLLTNQHNGEIAVERNGGTIFKITFPAIKGS